jgi:spore coat protein U-like protein
VSFGSYDPLSFEPLDGVGNIAVRCDADTSFTISLSSGSGSYAARQMTSGAHALEYNLFTDPSRLTVWGDGSAGSATLTASASSAEEAVYGRIAARQNVPTGTYTDVVVVTITY